MTRHVLVGLQAAAAVLLACGVVIGVAPVPLERFGCSPAFGSPDFEDGTSTDTIFECARERSQRQLGAAGALTLGGALLAGAAGVRRSTTLERGRTTAPSTSTPVD